MMFDDVYSEGKLAQVAKSLLDLCVAEDLPSADVTTEAVLGAAGMGVRGEGIIRAEEKIIFCGGFWLKETFKRAGGGSTVSDLHEDGGSARKGDLLARVHGPVGALLSYERMALNGLQRFSGIATQTNLYVKALAGADIQITDTRKTTPGHRLLEKYAVMMGGGSNHRFSLSDAFMIKDNHIALCGGVKEATLAVLRARENDQALLQRSLVIECSTLEEVHEVMELPLASEDSLLLDNLDHSTLTAALKVIKRRVQVEVSGGIGLNDLKRLRALNFYINRISIGALTHSVMAANLSMDITSAE